MKPWWFALSMFLLVAGSSLVSAQNVADPNDGIYTDLQVWQSRGLTDGLPPLRPYPAQLISALLEEVQANGDAQDREKAARYLSDVREPTTLDFGGSATLRSDVTEVHQQYGVALSFHGMPRPDVSFSGSFGAIATNGALDSALPRYQRVPADVVYDGAVAPLGSSGLTPKVSSAGVVAFGDSTLYVQAGIQRVSFGNFWGDNIVLSSDAPQAGAISLVFRQGIFTYSSLFMDISAVNLDGTGGPFPDKFLSLHSVEGTPFPWITLGAFETVVWGGRFQPTYLIPFPVNLFYVQGMFGYPDNSFVGLSVSVRFPQDVNVDAMLYVDDAAFNYLIKLRFNTMLVLSGQAGVTWTPHLPWLEQAGLSYMLITPYTYSHTDTGPVDYEDYTNAGQNMGPSLQPDSDKLELKALVRPLPWLDVSPFVRFIRHGNGSEGIPGGGNGTIFDSGFVGGVPTFTPAGGYPNPPGGLWTRFLTQTVIEKTFQAGLDASARLETKYGTFKADLGYTFEYVANVDLGATNVVNNYFTLSAGYSY